MFVLLLWNIAEKQEILFEELRTSKIEDDRRIS